MDFDKKDGFSYLDNIPFKISSAFLPPPPIVIPTVSNSCDELSFEKYDFSKEKEILENIKKKEESVKASFKTEDMCKEPQDPSPAKTGVQNIFSLQSDILLPKPQKALNQVSTANEQNNSKINLSDFENDTSSPFDYVELQTINDLEELSNVFQGLNNKYSSDVNVYKDNSAAVSANENNVPFSNVSKSMSFPLQNSDVFENSEKYLTYPKVLDAHGYNAWSASLTDVKENSLYSVPHSDGLQEDDSFRTVNSTLPKVPCLSSPNNNVGNSLQDFEVKTVLRGCKSYSDIHNLSECSETDVKPGRSYTPPTNIFTATEIKPISSSAYKNEVSSGDNNCDNSTTVGLPDPYNELSEEDRKFVDAIADMGFSRAQVSRTVKHLGSDEKNVVEHLCQIQSLEESGYDPLEAEAALHLHDYNQDEAKKFLDLINKFQDLGFEKNAVKKALIQNKNDCSKTIDALLS